MGTVTASLGWPPPDFFSSSLLFSDGVDCEGPAVNEGNEAAEPALGGMTASGVCASPGGGRLGGGIDVSMAGLARPAGDGAGGEPAGGAIAGTGAGVGAGEPSSMGAKVATEVEASLLRAGSLLRDGIVCVCIWRLGECGLLFSQSRSRSRQHT